MVFVVPVFETICSPIRTFKSLENKPGLLAQIGQATAIETVFNKCPQSSLLRRDMVFYHSTSSKGRQEITLTRSAQSIFTAPLTPGKLSSDYLCSLYLADPYRLSVLLSEGPQ